LWAGRLSPEKGLHRFLPAIALVRRLMPVQLTVLDASGPETYHRGILRTIDRLQLGDVVRWQAAVPREEIVDAMAAHDLFLFHSIFDEPVAQLLLSAFAAGTVVVAAVPRVKSVIRPGETAMTFADERPAAIAETIVHAARDEAARHRVRIRAFALVNGEQSLDRSIAEYDRLLAGVTGLRLQVRA
jgi:glycosyltransferase involved in cell wall biosynthesis